MSSWLSSPVAAAPSSSSATSPTSTSSPPPLSTGAMSAATKQATANVSISMVRQDAEDTLTSVGSGGLLGDEASDDESNNLQLVLPRTTEGGRPQRIRVCLEWSSSANGFVKCQTIATAEGDDDDDDGGGGGDGDAAMDAAQAGSRDGGAETGDLRFRKKRSDLACENIEIDENGPISDGNGPKREKTDGNKKPRDLGESDNNNGASIGSRERLDVDATVEPNMGATCRTPHLTEEGECLGCGGEDTDGADSTSRKIFAPLATAAVSDEQSEAQTAPGPSEEVPDHLFVTPPPQSHLQSQRRAVQAQRPNGLVAPDQNRKNGHNQPILRLRQRNDVSLAAAPQVPNVASVAVAGDGAPLLLTPVNVPATQAAPLAPLMPTLDTPSTHRPDQFEALSGEAPPQTPQTAALVSPPGVIRHTGSEVEKGLEDAGGDPVAETSMPLMAPDLADTETVETPQPTGQKPEGGAGLDSEPHRRAEGVKPSPIVHRIGGTRRRSVPSMPTHAAKEPLLEVASAGAAEGENHSPDFHNEEGQQQQRNVASPPTVKPCLSNKSDKSGGTQCSASMGLSTLAEIYTDKQRAYYVNSGTNRIDPATVPNPSCVPPERSDGEGESPAGSGEDQAAEHTPPPPSAGPAPSPPHASQHEAAEGDAPGAAPPAAAPHPQNHREQRPRPHDPRDLQDPYGGQPQHFAQPPPPPPPNAAPPMAPWPPPPAAAYPPPPPPHHDPYQMYRQAAQAHPASAYPPGGYHPHPYAGYHQYPYPSPMMYNPYAAYAYQYGMYLEQQQNHPPDMRGTIIDVNDEATETSSITLPVALPPAGGGGGEGGPHGPYHHRQRRGSGAAAAQARPAHQPEAIEEEGLEFEASEAGEVMSPDSPCDSAEETTQVRPKSSSASTERTKNADGAAAANGARAGDGTATVRSAPNPPPAKELDVMGQIVEMLTPASCAATTTRTVRNLGALQPYHSVLSMNQHIGIYRDRMSTTSNNGRRRAGGSASSSRSDSGSLSPTSSVHKKGDHYHSDMVRTGMSHLRGSFL